jgi:spore germination protein
VKDLFSKWSKIISNKTNQNQNSKNTSSTSNQENEQDKQRITASVRENTQYIKNLMDSPGDLIIREFTAGSLEIQCALVYIDGLVNQPRVDEFILKAMQSWKMAAPDSLPEGTSANDQLYNEAVAQALSIGEVNNANDMDRAVLGILSGDTALFISQKKQAILLGTRGWTDRAVEEPVSEAVIRGPRDGFNENLRTNTMLIRRRLRDPNLRFDHYKVGRRSKLDLSVVYIDGIVNPDLVKEVNKRLKSIDVDDAPESGFIEQWIQDSFLSPFPQLGNTERPDKVSSAIIQGKVAIILDGTPFVLILPETLSMQLHSTEDFADRWLIATSIRFLRYLAAFIAVFLPGLYIALVEYHQGMIPPDLAFSIAATREGVPFPAFLEAVLMEVTLEILREAGIRLPKPIGQTIGIVGGLVIGEAAVTAGIVSPIMVIVVALTAVSTFALPSYNFGISLRLIRFTIMGAAAMFGFFGLVLVYIMINIHIANLKSFGMPYSTPFAPTFLRDFKDLLVRAPMTNVSKRPDMLRTVDNTRSDTEGEEKS